jgi:hypothetical protein
METVPGLRSIGPPTLPELLSYMALNTWAVSADSSIVSRRRMCGKRLAFKQPHKIPPVHGELEWSFVTRLRIGQKDWTGWGVTFI